MAETELAPSAQRQLAMVLDRYERAPFGRLNETAAELGRVCEELGWHVGMREGYLPWAKRMLGRRA